MPSNNIDIATIKKINSEIKHLVSYKGYLTTKIDDFLNYVNQRCDNLDEKIKSEIEEKITYLSSEKENMYQNFYVISLFLNKLVFNQVNVDVILSNIISKLKSEYSNTLNENEIDINLRMISWNIIEKITKFASMPMKKEILTLCNLTASLKVENDIIRTIAVKLALSLN